MDPALQEQLDGNPDDTVEVVVRIHDGEKIPAGFQVIARFGKILTGRVYRKNIRELWSDPDVASVKASRLFMHDSMEDEDSENLPETEESQFSIYNTRPWPFNGSGIFYGAADWGIDFSHPNFLYDDGTTRIRFLWDQTGDFDPANNPYGYGKIFSKEQIDAALRTENPFATLGYHPGRADIFSVGSHGTHVMDIAAGNGHTGFRGMAPGAMILAVHLGSDKSNSQHTIGNSVRLLEGIYFLDRMAAGSPLVINLSLGKHGGPHTGMTLVEQALDELCSEQRFRMITQSAGNYFQSDTHTSGRISQHETKEISWLFPAQIIGHHELEFWYSGKDSIGVSMPDAEGDQTAIIFPGEKLEIRSPSDATLTGRIYNRKLDPNTGFNHIHIYLYSPIPLSTIRILLKGKDITEGWYHGWIERVVACRICQSVFNSESVDRSFTTGTISNGRQTISVGAFDHHDPSMPLAFFSSAGPTVDLRTKPQCIAPGVKILAAKSSSIDDLRSPGRLTYKSGTSMAAPFVAGTCILIADALRGRASALEAKRLLNEMLAVHSIPEDSSDRFRRGGGILTIDAVLQKLNELKQGPVQHEDAEAETDEEHDEEIHPEESNGEDSKAFDEIGNEDEDYEGIHQDENDVEDYKGFVEGEKVVPDNKVFEEENIESEYVEETESVYFFNQQNMENTQAEPELTLGEKLMKKLENLEAAIEDKAGKFTDRVKNWLRTENLDGSLFRRLRQAIVPGEEEDIEIIGFPGQPLEQPVHVGDILIRRAFGENLPLHTCIIADSDMVFPGNPGARRFKFESGFPGMYVHVIEDGPFPVTRSARLARRLLDPDGFILYHQMLVRPRRFSDEESEDYFSSDPSNKDFIRWVQGSLNFIQRSGLAVDGIAGSRTRAAIRSFQLTHGQYADGIVGPKTQTALVAAGATPYNPSSPSQGPVAIPDKIKSLLDQAFASLSTAQEDDADVLREYGSFDHTLPGKIFKVYFLRSDRAIIFYRSDSSLLVAVQGSIYQEYKKDGFGAAGKPNSKLGIPFSVETPWVTAKNTDIGRTALFDTGKIFWRRRDNRVMTQYQIPKDNLFWGVDSVRSYADLVRPPASLITKTGFIPCFIGQYLPNDPNPNAANFAAKVHSTFLASSGLTRILIIDNHGAAATGNRNGRVNGQADAASACRRADLCIRAYQQIAAVQVASAVLPESLVIYHDIEPEFHVDQDYIEGYIEGFTTFNSGSPIVRFNPGLYMSFHPTRAFNTRNIDNLPDKNIHLWAEHPNLPRLTEVNFIGHGYRPFSPTTVSCEVWQFNNADPRFATGAQFFIDHDMATATGMAGFWQGDSDLYSV